MSQAEPLQAYHIEHASLKHTEQMCYWTTTTDLDPAPQSSQTAVFSWLPAWCQQKASTGKNWQRIMFNSWLWDQFSGFRKVWAILRRQVCRSLFWNVIQNRFVNSIPTVLSLQTPPVNGDRTHRITDITCRFKCVTILLMYYQREWHALTKPPITNARNSIFRLFSASL